MNKISQIQSLWPQIYKQLKSPPPGVNLGSFPSKLHGADKFIMEQSPPGDKPSAIAYVTNADAQDGKISEIHVVVPRLEQALKGAGVTLTGPSDLQDPQNLEKILTAFVDLISHELGHISDYKADSDNPFPGGESVADSAANSAVQQVSLANDSLGELISVANELDSFGEFELADMVDSILFDVISDK